jgi:hypothetical protein
MYSKNVTAFVQPSLLLIFPAYMLWGISPLYIFLRNISRGVSSLYIVPRKMCRGVTLLNIFSGNISWGYESLYIIPDNMNL